MRSTASPNKKEPAKADSFKEFSYIKNTLAAIHPIGRIAAAA